MENARRANPARRAQKVKAFPQKERAEFLPPV